MTTTLKLYLFSLSLIVTGMANAQYVPKAQRAKKQLKRHWISKIEIPQGKKMIFQSAEIYCDTLIMHDKSTFKVDSVAAFKMVANYVQIGKKCVIDAQGNSGKKLTLLNNYPKTYGKNGARVSLLLNIYKMGSLKVNTRGGKAGKVTFRGVEIMGVGGSGGDVLFRYYAPFVIARRKRSRNKANVWFETAIGKMENEMAQYSRFPGDIRRQTRAMERHARLNDRLRRRIEMDITSRKVGKISVQRLNRPIHH